MNIFNFLSEIPFYIYFIFFLSMCFVGVVLHGMHDLNKDDENKKKPKKHKKA